ncbi:Hpt domain-containing protein [Thiocapsa sp.]|uniref:Hpt domain-containing protein n=1 Tax=Thiocapsa sp. TaxID=2024551 RepID=UPI002616CBA8|nr:Hpt domain-containing protein [Thiocapsa sp.]
MALDITKFVGRFVDEAREHIARLETGLATLGTAGDGGRDGIDALFRSAHTIKGSSRMLKLASIAETAHHLEDVLGVLRDGKIQPDPALAALLMRGVDAIGAMIEEVAASGAGAASGPPDQALCERLARPPRAIGRSRVRRPFPTVRRLPTRTRPRAKSRRPPRRRPRPRPHPLRTRRRGPRKRQAPTPRHASAHPRACACAWISSTPWSS